MKRTIFICCLLLFAGTVSAQKSSYDCRKTNEPIDVDGNSNEQIWNQIEPVWFVPNEVEPLKEKSWFKATWDQDYLYFLFWIEDQDIIGKMTQRDDHIWHEEVMEIFIDADCNPKDYYEFEWNPLNTLLDLYVLNPGCNRDIIRQWWSWDCRGIKSAVYVDGTLNNNSDKDKGWRLEVAIPFSEIQTAEHIPPLPGDVWRFDLTRREGTEKGGDLQKSSWLPPSCHFPLSYGKLKFKK
ncbi:hypothetical protein EYV94_00190 [Puteibacter caeruleilacunae]|nr:hypothetical protein EYV94_00190 [Puteibacter caeruleilacunae]